MKVTVSDSRTVNILEISIGGFFEFEGKVYRFATQSGGINIYFNMETGEESEGFKPGTRVTTLKLLPQTKNSTFIRSLPNGAAFKYRGKTWMKVDNRFVWAVSVEPETTDICLWKGGTMGDGRIIAASYCSVTVIPVETTLTLIPVETTLTLS